MSDCGFWMLAVPQLCCLLPVGCFGCEEVAAPGRAKRTRRRLQPIVAYCSSTHNDTRQRERAVTGCYSGSNHKPWAHTHCIGATAGQLWPTESAQDAAAVPTAPSFSPRWSQPQGQTPGSAGTVSAQGTPYTPAAAGADSALLQSHQAALHHHRHHHYYHHLPQQLHCQPSLCLYIVHSLIMA
jgi:hypothetical protein